ncbi:MAG: NYN domain-containing protein [Anaerolineae bacterium]|nr:NYN domain-containing protein [Anaerolineae bacterium]
MSENGEVALFIDFENVRYGLKNTYGLEPEPQKLMEKARKYGPVALANAYADFTEHPEFYRRKLEVAGISPRDIPRRSPDVAHKSSSDMAMLLDIIDCLLDRPTVTTLILMTGDSDFIRAVARARYRFNKKVVVAGVPGCVSNDLIAAADLSDPVFEEGWTPIVREPVTNGKQYQSIDTSEFPDLQQAEIKLLKLIEYLDRTRPYLTFLFVKTHALAPSNQVELTAMQVDMILTGFKERQILVEEIRDMDGRTLRLLHFRREHPEVQLALAASAAPPAPLASSPFEPETETTADPVVEQELTPASQELNQE